MILTKKEIQKEIRSKRLKVTPNRPKNIGPASLDLTLSNEIRVFKKNKPITLSEKTDYKEYTTKKKITSITLQPGDFILGITEEKITLPEDLVGLLSGRTRFARLGIIVHATAFFVQPGVSNRQVLEIKNISHETITLKPGLKIAQITFARTEGKAKYTGHFKKQ